MALYSYKKKTFGRKKKILTLISYGSMTIGALFLFWSFYPVLASEMYNRVFIEQSQSSAISSAEAVAVEKSATVKQTDSTFTTNLTDYTKASNWFVEPETELPAQANPLEPGGEEYTGTPYATAEEIFPQEVLDYTLSIPKLNIQHAKVIVNGENLLDGLIHYQAQGLPGENGTVSIFGHSTVPTLHREESYKSVFTYLPTLSEGDIVHVKIGGVQYTYEIFEKIIVQPNEISVLEQKFDDSYLNLITCVPLGTYQKRLVTKARLVNAPL